VDWSTVIAGVVGAVLGSLFTVGGTWWVSIRLDRQRANRELAHAIGVVFSELEDNRSRVSEGLDIKELRKRLTLGDWAGSKGSFAALALRNRELWKGVVRAYQQIYEFRSGWIDEFPTEQQLSDYIERLQNEQRELGREIGGFTRIRS
jgi:hypothetical protein